jgi:hypothetical protein
VENVTDGVVLTSENRTTQYSWDGDDHVTLLTAVQPNGGVQQSQYDYGYSAPSISSNDLLASIYWPAKDTGEPTGNDEETFAYNALDQARTTDRNGTNHSYTFDVLGPQTSDQVQSLGSGVDRTVRRLDTAYDTGGRHYLFTSYGDLASTVTLNQLQRSFNGLSELTTEYQAHAGTVSTVNPRSPRTFNMPTARSPAVPTTAAPRA